MAQGFLAYVLPVGGGGPVDPGYGIPGWGPVDPGYGQGGGFRPGHDLPWAPVRPDHGLPGGGAPTYPSGQPVPPPMGPVGPIGGGPPVVIPAPPGTKPVPPDAIYPPLAPPGGATKPALILVFVLGVGYRWITAEVPDHTLPPSAGTKPVEPPAAQPKH